jgi:hypothetical protein
LHQSPFIDILSQQQGQCNLNTRARPASTPLTSDIAREICQRTDSKAYIAGSIPALGREYVVGLKAASCQTGDAIAGEQVTADRKEQVLWALLCVVRLHAKGLILGTIIALADGSDLWHKTRAV